MREKRVSRFSSLHLIIT